MLVEDVRRRADTSNRDSSTAYFGRNDNAVAFAESCTERFEVRDQKFEIRCGY